MKKYYEIGSLCNQVVVNPPMASDIFSIDHIAKVSKLEKKKPSISVSFVLFMLKMKLKHLMKVQKNIIKMLKFTYVIVIDLLINSVVILKI